jgi:hypothetical protein
MVLFQGLVLPSRPEYQYQFQDQYCVTSQCGMPLQHIEQFK